MPQILVRQQCFLIHGVPVVYSHFSGLVNDTNIDPGDLLVSEQITVPDIQSPASRPKIIAVQQKQSVGIGIGLLRGTVYQISDPVGKNLTENLGHLLHIYIGNIRPYGVTPRRKTNPAQQNCHRFLHMDSHFLHGTVGKIALFVMFEGRNLPTQFLLGKGNLRSRIGSRRRGGRRRRCGGNRILRRRLRTRQRRKIGYIYGRRKGGKGSFSR